MFHLLPKKKKKFPLRFPSTLFVQRIRRIFCEQDKGRKRGGRGDSIKEILSVAARAIGRRANANINPNQRQHNAIVHRQRYYDSEGGRIFSLSRGRCSHARMTVNRMAAGIGELDQTLVSRMPMVVVPSGVKTDLPRSSSQIFLFRRFLPGSDIRQNDSYLKYQKITISIYFVEIDKFLCYKDIYLY